ncbi:hypothetical protein [Edaphobacter albus]|uniref:hypothetical protein n=1 Tax=Edaphobacter sp. 4G125 TaxID=2763071 RepID=UPI0016479094|nr:hypothetical protein [Edaphobacter sp. 4G125]QNI37526.1 hypothetical protein H7846_04270 [Edaphobacter sp. 4G125]
MGNTIAGRVHLDIGGKRRTLACDMNAGEVLFNQRGEHWVLWLIERFVGTPVRDSGKVVSYRREKMSPVDEIATLYALLATDREDTGIEDSEKVLRRSVGMFNRQDVSDAITKAILASFGVPGEDVEVVADAADAPRGNAAA